jgi:preprotein translocase subunit Sss1
LPIALLLVDVLIGTPLQFNSALGYSPTVAGRFTGFSNPAYAIVAASSVIAAPLLAHRIGGRRGAWAGIALLGAVIVIDGAPFWGSDVGGILSMVPTFGVTAVLLLGLRVRWRTVGWCVLGLVVVLGAATALDMSRAPERRTHLGRLVERIDERGIGDFVVVVQRKLGDNLGSLRGSVWGFMLPIALILALWLVRRAPNRLEALVAAVPEVKIAGIGLAIVGLLGWVLNDSGIAIPGVMIAIAIAALVWLLVRTDPDRPPPARADAPERAASRA